LKTKQVVFDTPLPVIMSWSGNIADDWYTVIEDVPPTGAFIITVGACDIAANILHGAVYWGMDEITKFLFTRTSTIITSGDVDGRLCVCNLPGVGLVLKNRLGATFRCFYDIRTTV